jgi:hypothetical protein
MVPVKLNFSHVSPGGTVTWRVSWIKRWKPSWGYSVLLGWKGCWEIQWLNSHSPVVKFWVDFQAHLNSVLKWHVIFDLWAHDFFVSVKIEVLVHEKTQRKLKEDLGWKSFGFPNVRSLITNWLGKPVL